VLGLPLSGGSVEVSSQSIGVCGEYTWPVPPGGCPVARRTLI
jgi:hypothetical protein